MDQIKKLFGSSDSLRKWVDAYNCHCFASRLGDEIMHYPNHLQMTALNGLIETVKWQLLKPIAGIKCMDALCAAAGKGDTKIVMLLFEKSLVSTSGCLYDYAIFVAHDRGHDEVLQFLLEHVKGRPRFTAMAIGHAINSGQSDLVELLSNLNDTHGVITHLVKKKLVEEGRGGHAYQLLLEKKPDIEKKKILLQTALSTLARRLLLGFCWK